MKIGSTFGDPSFTNKKVIAIWTSFFLKGETRRDVWLKVSQTNLKGLKQGNEVENIFKRHKNSESCHGLLSVLTGKMS